MPELHLTADGWRYDVEPSMLRRRYSHDYYGRSIYMLTLTTEGRQPSLGKLQWQKGQPETARVLLSPLGQAVMQCWQDIPKYYPAVHLLSIQIMPDHLHGLLFVTKGQEAHLGQVVKGFKAGATKALRAMLREVAGSNPPNEDSQAGQPSAMGDFAADNNPPNGNSQAGQPSAAGGYAAGSNPPNGKPQAGQPSTTGGYAAGSNPPNGDSQAGQPPAAGSYAAGNNPPNGNCRTGQPPTAGVYAAGSNPPNEESQASQPSAAGGYAASTGQACLSAAGYNSPNKEPLPSKGPSPNEEARVFSLGYQDSILRGAGQLERMFRYIEDNPRRLAVKREHPGSFSVQRGVQIGERHYDIIGNPMLLGRPRRVVHVSMRLDQETARRHMNNLILEARQGSVLVSPFISPREKMVMNEAIKEGLPVIQVMDNGFPDLYKPQSSVFDACASGLLLQVAPDAYRTTSQRISRARCLELNSLAEELCQDDI